MKTRERIFAAATAMLAAFVATGRMALAEAPDGPDMSWIDRAKLEQGEIEVRTDRDGRHVIVDTAALMAAPATTIWSVITECEVAPEYVPNVETCEQIEVLDDGRAAVFVQQIKPIFFLPRFEHVFRLDYTPHERIDMRRIDGPIEEMSGRWWLMPQQDGRVLVMHSLTVNPGFPVPRFLLRATMKNDLSKILEAIRDRSEARAEAPTPM